MNVNNVVEVTQNLSDLVDMTTERGDQNEINLLSVASVLNNSVNVFSSSTTIVLLSIEDASMVGKFLFRVIVLCIFH